MSNIIITTYNPSRGLKLDVKDDLIRDFPIEAASMVEDIKSYWQHNVEKHFNKTSKYPNPHVTHQIRNACDISTVGKTSTSKSIMIVELAEMYSNGFEYGTVLMKGREKSSHFMYVPALGVSVDIEQMSFSDRESYTIRNTTRGTTNDAWLAWKKEFNAYVRLRTLQFVRQCIKKGLIRRNK